MLLPLLFLLQAGDVPGEPQPDPPADLEVPAAPVLSPDEALAAFALPDDLVIELVAAEPLVVDPVQAVFDADGRLFVCEMRGFMPDIDGTGEDAPVGSIAILTDTDGDGRMDARTTFLDGLVLPRAVAPCEDGALVIAPPELLFCRDTDGDGVADEREVIARGLAGIASPEHAINGLDHGLDNTWRCANAPLTFRRVDGHWTGLPTAGGGQWGLSQDELGHAFFDNNSDPLRGDLYPSRYARRNPSLGTAAGANVRLCDDFRTFPARVTPGVNRGYRAGTLHADGRLASVTAACAPFLYRGDGLPETYRGDAFVCEPAGNLVLRYALEADGLDLSARRVSDTRDFLTSTDERFRPVGLTSGPDGSLLVVDLYRGVIQHRVFVTSFLRRQVEARGLAEPTGLGRLWRVRARGPSPAERPLPAYAETDEALIALLDHPNGWTRDAARRVVIEGGRTREVLERLRARVRRPEGRWGRIQALSALEELAGLDAELALALLGDADPEIVIATLRRVEKRLGTDPRLLERAVALGTSADARLAHQVLLSLGELASAEGDAALLAHVARDASTALRRDAALSGLGGRELEALDALLTSDAWREEAPGRARFVEVLAACIVREGRLDRRQRLVETVARLPAGWQRTAVTAGTSGALRPLTADAPAPIRLAAEPAGFATLAAEPDLAPLVRALSWPGHPAEGEVRPRALTAEESERFVRGREVFAASCVTCHLGSGQGEPGKAPNLRGSPRVLGDSRRLLAILLHGLRGPIPGFTAGDSAEMPALVAPDEDLAAVATYLRREWDHGADPVTPADAAAARAATATRERPWTLVELGE
jgi:mono/diheme cytochrome c family protein/glucose/arabinose dehydrogenase